MSFKNILITTIAAKTSEKFVDPFAQKEKSAEDQNSAPNTQPPSGIATPAEVDDKQLRRKIIAEEIDNFEYKLGRRQFKDGVDGDMGGLCKQSEIAPKVFFVKAALFGKANILNRHPELHSQGKQMKQFFITTGLGIAYQNDFEIKIYNIQRPAKEAVLPDMTYDYYIRLINAKKALAKKKPEKNLAFLVQSVNKQSNEKTQTVIPIEKMRENTATASRTFKMPY